MPARSPCSDVPSAASYFGTYEWLMRKMSSPEKGRHKLSVPRILFAGGTAGVVNWLVCLPADVAKSRYQTATLGTYRHIGSAYLELVSTPHNTHTYSASTHTHTHTHTHVHDT